MWNLLCYTLLETVMSNNPYSLYFFFTKVLQSQSDFFDVCIDFSDKPLDQTVVFYTLVNLFHNVEKKLARSLCGTISIKLFLYLSNWRLQRWQHFLGNTAFFPFSTFM